MPTIVLNNRFTSDVTVISNAFIDKYMVRANGEYVKIYLCILRLSLYAQNDWTLCTIADKLECTTKDVIRALNYWVKEGLIECEYNEAGQLTSLTFMDPNMAASSASSQSESREISENTPEPETRMSASRIRALKKSPEVSTITLIAEQYLGHLLTTSEQEALLYFYDKLHFSVDLIDYLIEYCVSRNASSLAYIKKVGFSWAEEGITTVEDAKNSVFDHSRECFVVMDAYGLKGRAPATSERKYIKTWLDGYKMPLDVILMAIDKTMNRLHSPRFEYTDSILRSWKDKGVQNTEDVVKLDSDHSQNKEDTSGNTSSEGSSSKKVRTVNAKSSFKGRDYDYSELEKQLLEAGK